ncbi:uncharacterized protein LOC120076007 isoform X2 [Benincasa hispida]|uniref:uncharacterized protein LOC120076007 isoform X2 n=1 Tax=Benincasa hispida TaxID=102211 RepID=UPI001900DBC6|nr:uncharacterized protein LOC120076007 isoform X2 [Benincasa hispida]
MASKVEVQKPSMEGLQRTISDISSELTKEGLAVVGNLPLPTISEVEAAACECCGLSEDCTAEYIGHVRDKFMGKLICGLCAEAVNEEMEKSWTREEALKEHMNACAKFNKIGRAYPVLYQAEAIKQILKKTSKSAVSAHRNGRIGRTSSCIPAITRDVCDNPTMVK